MKKLLVFIFLFVPLLKAQETLTQEEINDFYISPLDSNNYDLSTIINQIMSLNLIEALPKIEQNFWQQSCWNQQWFLDAMLRFNSTFTYQYSQMFLDSLSKPENEKYNGYTCVDILSSKVKIIEILYKLGDYSHVEEVFELIERDRLNGSSFSNGVLLLPYIYKYRIDLKEQAKQELLSAVNNAMDDYSVFAYSLTLSQAFGEEEIPEMIQLFQTITIPQAKRGILEFYFSKYENKFDLNELVKESLINEQSAELRLYLSKVLILGFATPSDYVFLTNYIQNEPNDTIKSLIQLEIETFRPPTPDSTESTNSLLNSLYNYVDSVYNYAWLNNLEFKDELQLILQSAKTNLQNGDSLACREDVKAFQDSVNYVFADSLNQDPRFVTLEGWKFLYWNAQYILDRLPEIPSTEGINTYSVFATHGVWLEQNSEVISGNTGVNEFGLPPFMDSGVELSIGIGTETPAGYRIKANRIKVKQNATVNSDVYYNELENNGTITGTLNTPLEIPLFTTLPEFHQSTPGTENIVVPQNGEYTLSPGAYGEIQVKKNGRLIFTGGEYHIFNFNGGDNNQLLFQSESEVRIKDKFDSGQGSYIGPEDTTTLSADEIIFYVEGINGNNGNLGATPKAAKIGISNTVKANFYVPNGTLWLRQNSEVEGSFIGKDVDVGIGVTVKLNSAF